MKEIIWDAYNDNTYGSQEILGAITTNAGQQSMRGGWKLIDLYED